MATSSGMPKCKVHLKEEVSLHCKQCDVLVCNICVPSIHNRHEFQKVPDAIKKKQSELAKLTNEISKTLTVYENATTEVKRTDERLKKAIFDLQRSIKLCNDSKGKHDPNLIEIVKQIKKKIDKHRPSEQSNPLEMTADGVNYLDEFVRDITAVYNNSDTDSELEQGSDNDPAISRTTPDISWTFSHKFDIRYRYSLKIKGNAKTLIARAEDGRQAWIGENGFRKVSLYSASRDVHGGPVNQHDRYGQQYDTDDQDDHNDGSDDQETKRSYTSDRGIKALAVTNSDELLILVSSVFGADEIRKISSDGESKMIYQAPSRYSIYGMAITCNDCIIVCLYKWSSNEGKVFQLCPSGKLLNILQYEKDGRTPLFTKPGKITSNRNDDIIVIDAGKTVTTINIKGEKRFTYPGLKELPKPFQPMDIVSDKDGNILICDSANYVIHILNKNGQFLDLLVISSTSIPIALTMDKSVGSHLWVLLDDKKQKYNTVQIFHRSN